MHVHDFRITRAQGMYGMFFQGQRRRQRRLAGIGLAQNVSLSAGVTVTGQTSGQTGIVRFTEGRKIYLEREASGKPFVTGEKIRVGGSDVGTVDDLRDVGNLRPRSIWSIRISGCTSTISR